MAKIKNFVFTLNNYTDDQVSSLSDFFSSESVSYSIFGYEYSQTGTPHLQGFVILANTLPFSYVKAKLFGAHIEAAKCRAPFSKAIDYCKKGGNFVEFGQPPVLNQIQSSLSSFYSSIREGFTDEALIDTFPDLFARHSRLIDRVRYSHLREKHKAHIMPKVIVLFGSPGSGKTEFCYRFDENLFSFEPTNGNWWDGYIGQKTVLFDDFYGGIKYSYLLKLLDKYPLSLPVKGGFSFKCWEYLFITSNKPPCEWYSFEISALKRRILLQIESDSVDLRSFDLHEALSD